MDGHGARLAVVSVLVAATALTTACSGLFGPDPEARRTLEQRPSFAEAEQGYLDLLTEIRKAVDGVVPALSWRSDTPRRLATGGCRDPLDTVPGARRANYGQGGAAGVVPDRRWDATVAAVHAVVDPHGFTVETTLRDRPGVHEVAFEDDLGARIVLETRTSTVLVLYGACFVADDGP